MHRTNIYLTDEQCERLNARAAAEGISRSELIRQTLDRVRAGESDWLSADLAAIEASFAALGAGEIAIDRGDGARGAHLDRIGALGAP